MAGRDEEFQKRLAATFAVEADEHLGTFSDGVIALEKQGEVAERQQIVEGIFREIHSLKGAARVVGRKDIERICQPLETVLSAVKGGQREATPELLDLFHDAAKVLRSKLESADADPAVVTVADDSLISELQNATGESQVEAESSPRIWSQQPPPMVMVKAAETQSEVEAITVPRESATETGSEGAKPVKAPIPAASQTIRIATAKLDALFRQSEELIFSKLAARQRVSEARTLLSRVQAGKANGQAALQSVEDGLRALSSVLDADRRSLEKMVDGVLEDAKTLLMLPCTVMFEVLPRTVRELARDQRKEIDVIIEGGDIEVDRRIQEQLKDALVHLARNCVDHGIESPDARLAAGKPTRGTIRVTAFQVDVSKVELVVSDDGAGIDLDKVREVGRRLGYEEGEQGAAVDEQELSRLIFRSGVSTSSVVTDLSGRGLGLAIVQEKVEKLGGTVSVEAQRGRGTTFRMLLPLTLAAMRGIVVESGGALYVFPGAGVERVLRVMEEDIRTVENRESVQVDGQVVSVVLLSAALGLPVRADPGEARAFRNLVIAVSGGERLAFAVDRIVGEQEVLLKGLGPQISRVRNVSGATVLGTGVLAPVLNVTDLIKSGRAVAVAAVAVAEEETDERSHRDPILVVEDSITARSLVKNILQTSGYSVETAVDGIDALTTLKTGVFSLVVSDVEMPRMDGFELTRRIRAHEKLAGIPVILVTALDSREHREQGIDAGADAYIVKSSFDQSTLIETIRRLI